MRKNMEDNSKESKSSINSKQKGSRVERELAEKLRMSGFSSARRSQQYSGNSGVAADIVCDELAEYHIECKGLGVARLQKSHIKRWYQQLLKDCTPEKIPLLFCKMNNQPWFVMCITLDLFDALPDGSSCCLNYIYEDSFIPGEYFKEKDIEFTLNNFFFDKITKRPVPITLFSIDEDLNVAFIPYQDAIDLINSRSSLDNDIAKATGVN